MTKTLYIKKNNYGDFRMTIIRSDKTISHHWQWLSGYPFHKNKQYYEITIK